MMIAPRAHVSPCIQYLSFAISIAKQKAWSAPGAFSSRTILSSRDCTARIMTLTDSSVSCAFWSRDAEKSLTICLNSAIALLTLFSSTGSALPFSAALRHSAMLAYPHSTSPMPAVLSLSGPLSMTS